MRRSTSAFLLVLTFIIIGILGMFVGTQFRARLFKPKFRLSQKANPKSKISKKDYLGIKTNLMSSICKNLRGTVKGNIPESLELDISKTHDEGPRSLTKILDTGHVDITGLKGFTHILREKLPVSRYTYKNIEQKGLMTGTPLDAVFIYFKEEHLNEPPLMVCPVVSIDDRDFDCYLRDSDNSWSQMENLMELDLEDDDFGAKLGQMIEEHYRENYKRQPTEVIPTEPKEEYNKFELDLSKKAEFSNDFVKVSEIDKIKVSGFLGYNHKFIKKSLVIKYEHEGVEQSGLPTDQPLDSVLTYFSIEQFNQLPLLVCPVTSESKLKFDCYLRDSDDIWVKSDEIGKLRIRDSKFGEKVHEIVDKHYSLRTRSSAVQCVDPEITEPEVETTMVESEFKPEDLEQEKVDMVVESQEVEPQEVEQTEEKIEDITEMNEVKIIDCLEISKHSNEEFDEYKVEEIGEFSTEGYKKFGWFFNDPSVVGRYTSGEHEQSGLPTNKTLEGVVTMFREDMIDQGPLVVCSVVSLDDMDFECYLRDADNNWSVNQQLTELDLMDEEAQENAVKLVNQHYNLASPESDNSDEKTIDSLDISKQEKQELDLYKTEEIQGLSLEGYKSFGWFFNDPSVVGRYTSGEHEQSGLPTNKTLEGVVTMFREDMIDQGPLVVCSVVSLDDMDFECYLRDADNNWSVNQQLTELDLMDEEAQENAVKLVNQHYNLASPESDNSDQINQE